MTRVSRRGFLLRGSLAGGAVAVGLPFLDYFLDGSGTAFAATHGGGPLPVRFGTWFWGCGVIPNRWNPEAAGTNFELPAQLAPLAPVRQHVNILSNFGVLLDGRSNNPHYSGNIGMRTGIPVDGWQRIEAPTIDVLVAETIGAGSFFRSLTLAADGNPETTYSYASGSARNMAISTPMDLYTRIFGIDFRDPNAADFKPSPQVMARRSVLSAITEQRRDLVGKLGAEDRARVDQYFTSIRDVENQLALQLQKPPPAEACVVPGKPKDLQPTTDVAGRREIHRVMSEMLAMALACNQTKVFNMTFATAFSDLRRVGTSTAYHQATHEEFVDRDKGYQPTVDSFVFQNMEAWADFVSILAAVKEGDGTLLDRSLVLAHSDVSYGKNHDVSSLPVMLAGRAGGAVKTGMHVPGNGAPVTRIGLTVQKAMGVPVDGWGTQSMRATEPLSELLA
jgi:hypothetical protein